MANYKKIYFVITVIFTFGIFSLYYDSKYTNTTCGLAFGYSKYEITSGGGGLSFSSTETKVSDFLIFSRDKVTSSSGSVITKNEIECDVKYVYVILFLYFVLGVSYCFSLRQNLTFPDK